jgi:hypothetical protein
VPGEPTLHAVLQKVFHRWKEVSGWAVHRLPVYGRSRPLQPELQGVSEPRRSSLWRQPGWHIAAAAGGTAQPLLLHHEASASLRPHPSSVLQSLGHRLPELQRRRLQQDRPRLCKWAQTLAAGQGGPIATIITAALFCTTLLAACLTACIFPAASLPGMAIQQPTRLCLSVPSRRLIETPFVIFTNRIRHPPHRRWWQEQVVTSAGGTAQLHGRQGDCQSKQYTE